MKNTMKSWFKKNSISYDLARCEKGEVIIKTNDRKVVLKHLNLLGLLNGWEYNSTEDLVIIHI